MPNNKKTRRVRSREGVRVSWVNGDRDRVRGVNRVRDRVVCYSF